jgi:hypothetical protein
VTVFLPAGFTPSLTTGTNTVNVGRWNVLLAELATLSPEPIEVGPVKLALGATAVRAATLYGLGADRAGQSLG